MVRAKFFARTALGLALAMGVAAGGASTPAMAKEKEKKAEAPKPLPEFGSAEDFPLQQALNKLQGKTVLVSKTMTERKPEDTKAQ